MIKNSVSCLLVFSACLIAGAYCCSGGWEKHGGSCYHFSNDTESWPIAMQLCRIMHGGELVEINTPEENIYLETRAKQMNRTYWIGLTDIEQEGSWFWVGSGDQLATTGVSDWAPGEPNNYINGAEGCVALYSSLNFRWTDAPCKWDGPYYICEKDDGESPIVG